jgi:hypothetical protein
MFCFQTQQVHLMGFARFKEIRTVTKCEEFEAYLADY